MKITRAKLLTAAILFLFLIPAFATARPENEARNSAEQWLALVEAGDFSMSWNTSSESFKANVSREDWRASLDAIHETLGALYSRKLKGVTNTRSLRGEPEGEYIVLQFQTLFINKGTVFETVALISDKPGRWKVCGYEIHSYLYD